MNINSLKRRLLNYYINSRGWTTSRKLIVIESDDWGSIRMPSFKTYTELLSKGFPVDKLSYLKYDALESNNDLEELFEVLLTFKDFKGNHPVITANTILTNPDFDKIRNSGFKDYHYELFTETLKRYPEHDKVFDLYNHGIKKKIFFPQLHGLEHLNVNRWMKTIQDKDSIARSIFNYELFDISTSHTKISESSFIDALSPANELEIIYEHNRLMLAAELFETCFGYTSDTFIAPCYIWRPELEATFNEMKVKNIQTSIYQLVPEIGKVSSFKKKYHYTGEMNAYNQTYTVRNCFFEPSSSKNIDVVNNCLIQINRAFQNNKPAVITSHRLNFIGYIDKENSKENLGMLNLLLKNILKEWPEAEFLTSSELARLIRQQYDE